MALISCAVLHRITIEYKSRMRGHLGLGLVRASPSGGSWNLCRLGPVRKRLLRFRPVRLGPELDARVFRQVDDRAAGLTKNRLFRGEVRELHSGDFGEASAAELAIQCG